jgi:hypothetical protein
LKRTWSLMKGRSPLSILNSLFQLQGTILVIASYPDFRHEKLKPKEGEGLCQMKN